MMAQYRAAEDTDYSPFGNFVVAAAVVVGIRRRTSEQEQHRKGALGHTRAEVNVGVAVPGWNTVSAGSSLSDYEHR